MNLTKLWDLQKELDRNILETHNLVENEELLQKKILALNVELGELANEWRGFKFWSNKATSPKEVLLEEYVDCLHFALSIGNQLGYKIESVYSHNILETNKAFIDCFNGAIELSKDSCWLNFKYLFVSLIQLAASLSFKTYEIEEVYLSKNQKNHKRQEDGY